MTLIHEKNLKSKSRVRLPLTIDTKTKCRRYLCLVEFIDWSHVGIFDPAL
jgi:hypothetical protein